VVKGDVIPPPAPEPTNLADAQRQLAAEATARGLAAAKDEAGKRALQGVLAACGGEWYETGTHRREARFVAAQWVEVLRWLLAAG
jgi:hypothetical protein